AVSVSGPFFGAWFLLNVADQESAASFFSDYGVSRSYLVGEMHLASGEDENIRVAGSALYFGLRVEF
ncbi:MAG: hypothetical protein IT285_05615, partial [Bdellovibrionales bacterium]|nr:hypothetical protein [Bdellovibrionales bacterium]